jgi:hypothetical protein
MDKTPYLKSSHPVRQMSGKGAPRETIFGVIGDTKEDPLMRSLGGLVHNTKLSAPMGKGTTMKASVAHNTERHIIGHASKTPMPGEHMGQVPYPGMYQSAVGARLS